MTLTFEAASHTYYLDGRPIPSVTQVLDPLQSWEGIPPEVLEKARIRGQYVHQACALLLQKQLEWQSVEPEIVGYVQGAQRCIDELEIKVLSVELRMCDPALRFAGTLDLMGIMGRQQCIFDWKSAALMPATAPLQLAAYDHLYRRSYGGRPLKRFGVQLFAEGGYRLYPYEDERDWTWFTSALNLYYWRKNNGSV